MSSPAAGKFQDHYKLLDIDPKSDLATVQQAHARLMACQPTSQQIEELNLALEVLSDPIGRKMFDAVRGGGDDDRDISFTGMEFFNSLQGERDRRSTLLCVLYDVRRNNPRVPLITMRQLEKIVRMTEEEIQLALWYSKTLGWVVVDDKSKMQITAIGVDYLQSNVPDPRAIWPYLKMDGVEPTETQKRELGAALAPAAPAAGTSRPVAVVSPPEPVLVAPPTPVTPAPAALVASEVEPPQELARKPLPMLRRTQVAVG